MDRLDLRKQFKHLYQPPAGRVQVVDVPPLKFAMVHGAIEPGCAPGISPAFQQAIEALYGISYTLKFTSKQRREAPTDYTVMPLEALWWADDGKLDISKPGNWSWTAMIMQPDHITDSMFREALERLRKKRPDAVLDRLRFEVFREGLCMQIMHVGPYNEEPATLAAMDAFARQNGYILCGKHHEIYLGDPRRSTPERLRTVLRHPIRANR